MEDNRLPRGSSDQYYSQKYKKFLETILKQLPKYIKRYPDPDQLYLTDFIKVLQGYNIDTQAARDKSANKIIEFIKEYKYSEIYYKLPFFWFAVDYFNNAARLLSVATYHGKKFYGYLVRHLRGDSEVQGVFSLIKSVIPLTDLKWEQLQYSCIKLQDPLSDEELQILESIHTSLSETPFNFDFLNTEKIKYIIQNGTKNLKSIHHLSRFFTRISAQWLLHYHRPAFGVEQLIFKFQLKDSVSLFDIIDFHDPSNALLCASDIYQIKGISNAFHGTLIVPARDINDLSQYLEKCADQGRIKLDFLEKVTDIKLTNSFKSYQSNEGWSHLSPTKKDILFRSLTTRASRKQKSTIPSFYCSSDFNHSWYFTQHIKPIDILKLYCKEDRFFYLNDLLDYKNGIIGKQYSQLELDLLSELIHKKVVQIGFYSYTLIREFSPDYYLVVIPQLPFFQLVRLLKWLPMNFILNTKNNIYLRTYLTPDMVKWIQNMIRWPIMAINLYFPPHNRNFNQMIDAKKSEWKVPHFLNKL